MKKYLYLFVFCCCIYVIRFIYSGHGIFGDGNGYWSYTHALFFQHNLDFHAIYKHLANFVTNGRSIPRVFWNVAPTVTGALPNHWLIGTGILWLPSMVFLSMIFFILRISVSAYSVLWELGPGVSGILMGLAGCYFVEQTIKKWWKGTVAQDVIFALIGITPLIYYIAIEPALSHSAIFFINSLLIYLCFTLDIRKKSTWFIFGLLAGLSAIIRITGVFIFLVPLFILWDAWRTKKIKPRQSILYGMCAVAGLVLFISPQLVVQQLIYGSFFFQPYAVGYQHQSISVWWLPESLFSVQRGFFFWHPTLLVGLWGLVKWRKESIFGYVGLACFGLLLLSVGFWGGVLSAGFGNRFFIELFPFFAFGLAYYFSKHDRKKVLIVFGLLCLWNALLLVQFFGDKPRMVDQKNLTYLNFLTGQFTVPFSLVTQLLHSLKVLQ